MRAASFLSLVSILLGCSVAEEVVLPGAEVEIGPVTRYSTDALTLLVAPSNASLTSDGRLLVVDRGDNVLKVYRSDAPAARIGVPGAGPGEFQALVSGGEFSRGGERLYFGYDLVAGRVSLFETGGGLVGEVALRSGIPAPIASLTTLSDSMWLASGWLPAGDYDAVRIFDQSGRQVGSVANLAKAVETLPPGTRRFLGVIAGGFDRHVFSAVHGLDTLLVHDTRGRLLAEGRLTDPGAPSPVLDVREEASPAEDDPRAFADRWTRSGQLGPRSLVALSDSTFAIQLAPFGVEDLLSEGGPVGIGVFRGGTVSIVSWYDAPGALLGRSDAGAPLVVGWEGEELRNVVLYELRVRFTEAT